MQTQTNPTPVFKDPVFYTPTKGCRVPLIIDRAKLRADGVYVGLYSGQSIDQVKTRYPDVAFGEVDVVIAEREAMLISAPVEISATTFQDALCVLPPEDYARAGTSCSFKMCEYLSDRITAIYASVDEKYYTFNDVYAIKHAQIVEKIRGHVQLAEMNNSTIKHVTQ